MVNLRVFGNIFQSLEHAYQWCKAMYLQSSDVAINIRHNTTAAHAKQITDDKLETGNTDWSKDRRSIMYELLMAKSEWCPDFLSALLQIADDELVEDTSHEYWARGRNGLGQNVIWKILMAIREGLTHQHSMKPGQEDYRPPAREQQLPVISMVMKPHSEHLPPPGISTVP